MKQLTGYKYFFLIVLLVSALMLYRSNSVRSDSNTFPPRNYGGFNATQTSVSDSEIYITNVYTPDQLNEFVHELGASLGITTDCAYGDNGTSEDYVFTFTTSQWSNNSDLDGNIKINTYDLPNIDPPLYPPPFEIVGGGYGLFYPGVYHICIGQEYIDWYGIFGLTVDSIVQTLTLHTLHDPLYTPTNFTATYQESNDYKSVVLDWTPRNDAGVVALILKSYDHHSEIVTDITNSQAVDLNIATVCNGSNNDYEVVSYYMASAIPGPIDYDIDYEFDNEDENDWDRSAWSPVASVAIPCAPNVTPPVSTNTPPPSNNCPSDYIEGVYFYSDTGYQGDCVFSTSNIAVLGNTSVGNDRLSSIKIIGEWKVDLFEDINYGGRHDTLYSSVANLDINSLGGQYSSAKVEDNTETCPTDNSEGVYLYSNKNYDGRCTFTTGDIADLGEVEVDNNDLSSIRVIGNYETKIYEHEDYDGLYDVVGSNDPDLDVRSLGGKYSSIRVYQITIPPTETSTLTPTPAPISIALLSSSLNNGGFESGNMSGWIQVGGTIEVDNENPYSGQYHVRKTTAVEASFYRTFDLSAYAQQINLGLGSTFFSAQIDVGKSENYRIFIKFLDANNGVLGSSDESWRYHPGGYNGVSGVIDTIPANTRTIHIEVGMKRSSGSNTDVDIDDISLTVQFGVLPAPTLIPTQTPLPTMTLTPATPIPSTSTPTPTPSGDYTQGVGYINGNTARIWFKPTAPAAWVDVHYTVNGGGQLNYRMTYNSSNSRWEQNVAGVSSGNVINYSFTYFTSTGHDTGWFSYTHSSGNTPTPTPTFTLVPTVTTLPTSTPTPTPSGDYTQGVGYINGSTARIWFKPTTSAAWVDVHYTVNGGGQLNYRMTYNGGNGRWEQNIAGVSSGNVINYSFTYFTNAGHDTGWFSYTHGSGNTPTPTSTSTPSGNYTLGVDRVNGSIARIWFKPTTSATWVDAHYTMNGGGQLNVRMTYNSGNNRWEQNVTGLSRGSVINYSFTYFTNVGYDTGWFTYTHQ